MRLSNPRFTQYAARIAVLVATSVLVAACGGNGVASAPTTDANGLRSVRTAEVQSAVLDTSVRAVGLLGPKDDLALGFKITGVIERIDVDLGDVVAKGELIAALDQTEIDAAVARAAEGALKAERDLARTRALYADDVATLEQVEHAETAFNVARADLEAARFNARHARIEAPTDGLVLRRLAEPAELVAAGEPVVVVGSLAEGWAVRAGVTDRDVVRLTVGSAARVAFDAFTSEAFDARITRIATASDPATGTYEVELAVAPSGAAFVQGLVAKVEIDVAPSAAARLWIPVEALLEANGAWADVAVVAHDAAAPSSPVAAADRPATGTIERRRVHIGELVGSNVEVRAGLAVGERVVTDGAAWVEDGGHVIVLAQAD
jgi:RND family efflux transporter MFP subunit